MIDGSALIERSVDAKIGPGTPHQPVNTRFVDIVDIRVQRCKYGALTEVDLALVFRYRMDGGDVGIDTVDEIVDGGVGWRETDIWKQ